MKRILVVLMCAITSLCSYCQVVNTEGGNMLKLGYYYSHGAYQVSVCDWYRDYSNQMHFSTITNSIDAFKSDLNQIQNKFLQWVNTARTNNVKEVEKEIPCTIRYSDVSCDAYASNATKVVVKPVFVVRNYVPSCEIRIWQYFYDRQPNYNVWHLSQRDIPSLVAAIEKGYKEYLANENKRQKTEDLFR